MNNPVLMVGLGEVLWDVLPSGRVLGGAPANFAYMASVLGNEGIVASRVGNDQLGIEACRSMQELGLKTTYIQVDDSRPTGTATVAIDSAGQPNFTIDNPASWDSLEWTRDWEELSARADVVCFGSLAQRSPTSSLTIEYFLSNAHSSALRICDVNLRQSFYSELLLRRCFQLAHVVKLNEQELLQVSQLLKLGLGTEEMLAQRLLHQYGLRVVCVTSGAHGSLLVSEKEVVKHDGFHVKVADAVGAGDAFTACLAHYYVRQRPFAEINEAANRFASWVATQRGATPSVGADQLQNILSGVPVR